MAAPAKQFETLAISGKLAHGGNPVLAWQANNVAADEDAAGNKKPSKKRSREKIDGIVAIHNALARYDRYQSEEILYGSDVTVQTVDL